MGLTDGSKALAYHGRKLGTKDTKFTLQAKAAGTKYVHFYRKDPLTEDFIDDYIEVIIEDEKGSPKTHVSAPEYKPHVPKKTRQLYERQKAESAPLQTNAENVTTEINVQKESVKPNENAAETSTAASTAEAESSAAVKTSAEQESPAPSASGGAENQGKNENIDVKSLLKEAEVLYNNKDYKTADKKIKEFLEYAVEDRDAGLFLQGQILEAKSEIQDIKSAIEAYKTLTKNYPASSCWDKANRQIIYLSRFYLEIR